jgi:hypothetical protein
MAIIQADRSCFGDPLAQYFDLAFQVRIGARSIDERLYLLLLVTRYSLVFDDEETIVFSSYGFRGNIG